MKRTWTPFWFSLFLLVLSSCSFKYQVFDLNSEEVKTTADHSFVYVRDSFEITYDFWADGGVMLFNVLNKTNEHLYILMDSSTFIFNHIEIPYHNKNHFQREPRPPSSEIAYSPYLNTSPRVNIPPHDNKWIEGFPVSTEWHRVNSQNNTKFFSKFNSPTYIINSLGISFEKSREDAIYVENEFWLSAVHQASKSRFKRIEGMTIDLTDKSYLKRSSRAGSNVFWEETAIFILTEMLLIL